MTTTQETGHPGLQRSVGFYGLMFVSLGSIIGSGWLLGALNAAQAAGPAGILSWVFGALMLTTLALVFAELGAAYPVAGGTGTLPVLLARPVHRVHVRLGVLAAGGVHRADRDPRVPSPTSTACRGSTSNFNMLNADTACSTARA